MKVKNIMFAGFASAILSGVCGAASAADYNLVTEGYVTEKLAGKADTGASYTKSETDTLLGDKVSTETYAQYIEDQGKIDAKQTQDIATNKASIDLLSGEDGTGIATLMGDVSDNKAAIETLTGEGEGSIAQKISTALTGYATEEYVAEELGDYALKSELPTDYVTTQDLTDAGYATTNAMNAALQGKQDTITDLADIRAGAELGKTAVQPGALESYVTTQDLTEAGYATTSEMNTALQGKQDTITDLADIRAGAELGETAVQPGALETTLGSYVTTTALEQAGYATTSEMNTALQGKQATIENLDTIIAGAEAGASAVQPGANVSVLVNDSGFQTAANVNTLIGQAQIAESQVTGLTEALAGKQAAGDYLEAMENAGTYLVQRAGDGTISYVSVEVIDANGDAI